MNDSRLPPWRRALLAALTSSELAHLAWEHLHGGIRSHHLLNRADLPAVSNAWGLLLVPALAWFLSGRIQKRIAGRPGSEVAGTRLRWSVVAGFGVALLAGLALSTSFRLGYDETTATIFMGLLVLALVLPGYRAECVLGFVAGMAWTFGAVLPTIAATLLATLSAGVHLVALPVLVRGWRSLRARRE